MNRRELCSFFGGALLLQSTGEQPTLHSAAYAFDQMPVHTSNGAQMRSILRGKTATGESVEVHETTLPPGIAPHPPHHHPHSEMWLVREGTLEFTVNGKTDRIGPGSAGYASSNEEHGVRNPGTTPVTYFVVAIGAGA